MLMSDKKGVKLICDSVRHSSHMEQVIRLYFTEKSGEESSLMLNDKSFYVNQEPITYRQLNHWEENGLLPKRESGWRKFSLMEALWLHIIYQLRSTFEIRHDGIKTIKECLTSGKNKYEAFMPIFEIYVLEALSRKRRTFLAIYEDKSAAPVNAEMVAELVKKDKFGHMLLLDINKLLKTIIPKYEWALNP